MAKFCFQFPGQGSQVVGMGKDFFQGSKLGKLIYEQADDVLKISLSKISFEGPSEKLTSTEIAQPALLTHEYCVFRHLIEEGVDPSSSIFMGHSLGEYGALTCAEVLSFEQGIRLVNLRGKFVQEAVSPGEGAMLAVVRLDSTTLQQVLELASEFNAQDDVCEPANFNSNDQVVFSGKTQSILNFQSRLSELKFKSVLLNVSAPFHCSLMEPAKTKLKPFISEAKFVEFKQNQSYIPNITGKITTDSKNVPVYLTEQITGSVKWKQSLEELVKVGTENILEIGPGKVLNGLMKKTTGQNIISVSNLETLKEFFAELRRN